MMEAALHSFAIFFCPALCAWLMAQRVSHSYENALYSELGQRKRLTQVVSISTQDRIPPYSEETGGRHDRV